MFWMQVFENCAQRVLALLPAVYGRGPKPHAPLPVSMYARAYTFYGNSDAGGKLKAPDPKGQQTQQFKEQALHKHVHCIKPHSKEFTVLVASKTKCSTKWRCSPTKLVLGCRTHPTKHISG